MTCKVHAAGWCFHVGARFTSGINDPGDEMPIDNRPQACDSQRKGYAGPSTNSLIPPRLDGVCILPSNVQRPTARPGCLANCHTNQVEPRVRVR